MYMAKGYDQLIVYISAPVFDYYRWIMGYVELSRENT